MRSPKRNQIISSVLVLLVMPALVGLLVNNVPDLKPYSWLLVLLSILLILSVIVYILLTVRRSAVDNDVSQITPALLEHFRQTVSETEKVIKVGLGLGDGYYWRGKIIGWQNDDEVLIKTLKVNDKRDWKPKRKSEQTERFARWIVHIMKAIVIVISQYGFMSDPEQRKDLIKLAPTAYTVGVALQKWEDAAEIAYALAQAYHTDELFVDARIWVKKMEKCLQHVNSDEFQSKLQDITGSILKDAENNPVEAERHFEKALNLARNSSNPLMIWTSATHLGNQKIQDKKLNEAEELYKEALTCASQLKDPVLKIKCYRELGDLAIRQRRFPDAEASYTNQLNLAKNLPSGEIFEGLAHKRIAEALKEIAKTLPKESQLSKVKAAYQHAKDALKIEQAKEEPNVDELRILLIDIADILLLAS